MNFISADKSAAFDSYGYYYQVGDIVRKDSNDNGDAETAVIKSFEVNEEMNEVKVFTDKGWNHIDFLVNTSHNTTVQNKQQFILKHITQ